MNPWKILGWLLDMIAVVSLMLIGWFASYTLKNFELIRESMEQSAKAIDTRLDSVENRISVREGNAYTAQQAGTDNREIWKEIATIKRDVATLPQAAPPQWFLEKVNKLETKQEDMLRLLLNNKKILEGLSQ